jgi:hypothetical protein
MTDAVKKSVEAPKPVVAKAKVIPAPKPRVTKKAVKPAAPVEKPAPEIVPGIKENRSVSKPAQEEVNDKEELPVSKKVKREEWDDLDTPEMGDPSMMAEYAVEIFEYMKVLEVSFSQCFYFVLGGASETKITRVVARFKGSNDAQS